MNPDFHAVALVINTDGMGDDKNADNNADNAAGDHSLRHRLLTTYLKTLIELETPPQSILLYAAGVKIATHASACRAELTQLREAGSQIIACRTCLDFYGLMDQVPEAEIGNMLRIIEAQSLAAKVITL
ncbi:hypothetical protein GCM10027046_05790 [Uliginosibacterium flavum]|uniref:DsrE family protein n=1 Tax=Uliginosibacterium flavum TaxID=1396831 RepID=A0ABV2TIW1_9RHOO